MKSLLCLLFIFINSSGRILLSLSNVCTFVFLAVNRVSWSENYFLKPLVGHRMFRIHKKVEVFPLHVTMMYGGKEVYLHSFLMLALDAGEWAISIPDCWTLGESALNSHWIGAWVDPRVWLGHIREETMPLHCHELMHHSSVYSHKKKLKTCFPLHVRWMLF